jgi:O-antigen/teichoic acid export membrane protein
LEIAIPSANDLDRINLYTTSLYSIITNTIIITSVAFIICSTTFVSYILLLPFFALSLISMGLLNVCMSVLSAEKKYGTMVSVKVLSIIITYALPLFLGGIIFNVNTLLFCFVISNIVVAVYGLISLPNRYILSILQFKLENVKLVFKSNKQYIYFNLPQSLIDNLSSQGSVFMTSGFLGFLTLGQYNLYQKVAYTPINLVTSSVAQVLYRFFTEIQTEKRKIFKAFKLYRILFIVAAIFFSILYFFIPSIVSILFGAKWHESSSIIQVSLLYLFFYLMCAILQYIPFVKHKLKTNLIYATIWNVYFLLCFFVGVVVNKNLITALYLINFGALIYYPAYLLWIYNIYVKEK